MLDETTVVVAIKDIIKSPKGKCYAASEAAYHLLGGKEAGYTPAFMRINPRVMGYDTHWALRRADGSILDITAEQFSLISYDKMKGCGFLTKKPSKKAQEIIDEVQERRKNSQR